MGTHSMRSLTGLFLMLFLVFMSSSKAMERQAVSGDGTLRKFRQHAWWLSSYPSLVAKLNSFPGKSWKFVANPPNPEEQGTVKLTREGPKSVLLTSKYKQQAIKKEEGFQTSWNDSMNWNNSMKMKSQMACL